MIDASAFLAAQVRLGRGGEAVAARLEDDQDHCAPQILKAESLSGLRTLVAVGVVADERAWTVAGWIEDFLIETYPIEAFVPRIWALRDRLGVYDAWYVALAEALQVPLVTINPGLAHTPGIKCEVELFE